MPRSADPSPQEQRRLVRRGRGLFLSLIRWLWGWTRWIGARFLALMVVLVLIFSEVLPKTYAILAPEDLATTRRVLAQMAANAERLNRE